MSPHSFKNRFLILLSLPLFFGGCDRAEKPDSESTSQAKAETSAVTQADVPTESATAGKEPKGLRAGDKLPADAFGGGGAPAKSGDPLEGLQFLEGDALENAIASLSEENFQAAMAALLERPANPVRDKVLVAFGVVLARKDPESAMKMVAGLAASDLRNEGVTQISTLWGAKDPAKGIAYADTLEDRTLRDLFLKGVVDGWARTDPGEAFYNLSLQPGNGLGAYLSIAATHYAKLDLRAALDESIALEDRRNRSSAMRAVFRVWALDDPNAAFAHALSDEQNILRSVAGELATAMRESGSSPNDLVNAISKITAPEARFRFMRGMVDGMSPESMAVIMADPRITADEGLRRMTVSFASRELARTDIESGFDMAEKMTNPTDRVTAYRSVGNEMASQDPVAAKEFLSKMTPGPDRDGMVTGVLWSQARNQPAEAASLATTISDPTTRERSVGMILQMWKRRDEAAASSWAESAGLKQQYDNLPASDGRNWRGSSDGGSSRSSSAQSSGYQGQPSAPVSPTPNSR